MEPLFSLPKAELHLHIEGTLEPELAFALARRNRVALPFADVEALRAAYSFSDLQSFLDLYYSLTDVLRNERDFADLTLAYLRKASSQGVRHVEMFFDPQAHTSRGVPLDVVMNGLVEGCRQARAENGISTSLIACFMRHLPASDALATLASLEPYLPYLAGIGLDSSEVGFPPSLFVPVYDLARSWGLHLVAHAGEEGPPAYVWSALDDLGVSRIDHGVRVLEDAALVDRLRRDAVPLTVCPFSNVRLRVVPSLDVHMLPKMVSEGLTVTVNSDDPAYFGGYVGDNYVGLARALGVTVAGSAELARASFRSSFLTPAAQASFLGEVDAWEAAQSIAD